MTFKAEFTNDKDYYDFRKKEAELFQQIIDLELLNLANKRALQQQEYDTKH